MILAEDKVTHLYIQAHLYNSCNANFWQEAKEYAGGGEINTQVFFISSVLHNDAFSNVHSVGPTPLGTFTNGLARPAP